MATLAKVFFFAALLRVLLMIYGHWHDLNFEVRYTDVDYQVFSDAAGHVFNGRSPYQRSTYRYTPLLAFLMLPNSWIHRYFGKIFFSFCDLFVGALLLKILKAEQAILQEERNSKVSMLQDRQLLPFVLVWLFNPLTLTVSTRGNAESFQALLVLAALLCVLQKRRIFGGLFYGLAVHFKIYPVIYSLPILLFMLKNCNQRKKAGKFQTLIHFIIDSIKASFCFVLSTGITLILVTLLLYQWYGMEFIEETYLYHLTRKDIKHNFSPYFYLLYLTTNTSLPKLISLLAFLPQAISVAAVGVKYHSRLSLACFLQTFAFVTFNKVCTSQYFIWYLSLLPLALPHLHLDLPNSCWMLFLWISSQAVWLFFAYLLEFRGMQTFFLVWMASLSFFIVNVYILIKVISNIKSTKGLDKNAVTEKMKNS